MSNDAHDSHEGPIKTPKQLVTVVVLSFVVPIVVIILLINYVASHGKEGAGTESMSEEAVAARIQPVGSVAFKEAGAAGGALTGAEVYKARCASCHESGMLGSPKFGDAAAWGPRLAQGLDALVASALKGKNAMPAQGGSDLSDTEIARGVVYMANAAGGKFEEPKGAAAPAADAPAAEAAASAAAPDAASAPAAAAPAATAEPAAPAAPVAEAKPAAAVPALYNQICLACHASGAAGAPKVGDKAAWAPRLALGVDGLTASAIKGKNAMPPKGGAMAATDAQIKEVVAYMVNASK